MQNIGDLKNILNSSPKLNFVFERTQEYKDEIFPFVLIDYDRDISVFHASNTTKQRRANIILRLAHNKMISPQFNILIKKLNDNGIFYQLLSHSKDEKSGIWEVSYLITFSYNKAILK